MLAEADESFDAMTVYPSLEGDDTADSTDDDP
jgi:hypothetical protein